jgi:hypothetical protein
VARLLQGSDGAGGGSTGSSSSGSAGSFKWRLRGLLKQRRCGLLQGSGGAGLSSSSGADHKVQGLFLGPSRFGLDHFFIFEMYLLV